MINKKLLELNPDAFSRFQVVCKEIKEVYGSKKISILDIGGASSYLYKFLEENNIEFDLTIVDIIDFEDKPKAATVIIQSAEKLSFSNDTYDVVTGIDMLEHLPSQDIKNAIFSEAIRVSKGLVIFAGPCETQNVTNYEHRLDSKNKLFFGSSQPWLKEHFAYGKPALESMEEILKSKNIQYNVFTVLPLHDWYISSLSNLTRAISETVDSKSLNETNRDYNKYFVESEDFRIPLSSNNEGYRTFVVANKIQNRDIKKNMTFLTSTQDAPLERYIEILADNVYETRTYSNIRNDLVWYKQENERLKNETKRQEKTISDMKNTLNHRLARKISKNIRTVKDIAKDTK